MPATVKKRGPEVSPISVVSAAVVDGREMDIQKNARAKQKLQQPMCLWLTGLPAAGKSTIAIALEKRLFAAGRHTYLLDGDDVRLGLNNDLGFSETDRIENIRRASEVARLLVDAGLIVIVSFISPYRAQRDRARSLFEPEEFLEIFVDAPLEECERRDPKGMYAKARRGELSNFTGIDSPYEFPVSPEVHLQTALHTPDECVDSIYRVLAGKLYLDIRSASR
jgi:bifunctional enzyme CysN/CysC